MAAVAALALCAGQARAQQQTAWQNAGGGLWSQPSNWQNGIPNGAKRAQFGPVGVDWAYTVQTSGSSPTAAALDVTDHFVTIDMTNATGNLTLSGGGSGSTIVVDRAGVIPGCMLELFTSGTSRTCSGINGVVNGRGVLNVTGNTVLSLSGTLTVGSSSHGHFNVGENARATITNLALATSPGAAFVSVSGPNSAVEYDNSLTLGSSPGSGAVTMDILDGGQLRSIGPASVAFMTGTVTIDGAGSKWKTAVSTSFTMGGAASFQTIDIKNGGVFEVTDSGTFTMGQPSGMSSIQIGSGSQWTTTASVTVGNDPPANQVQVFLSGGTFQHSASLPLRIYPGGNLLGSGTLTLGGSSPAIINSGVVGPFAHGGAPYGTLDVTGIFNQIGGSKPGTLRLNVQGGDTGPHDVLNVSGNFLLGGTLIVGWGGGLPDPENTLSLPIITAGGFANGTGNPAFNVVILPGLPDNRFYRVAYPGIGGGTIALNVQSLFSTPDFDGGSASSTLNATVTAADVGDIDEDGFDDLAVTTSDGFLFLLSGNGDGTFSQVIQLPVGNDPRGVVIADLDPSNPNDNGLDVVVSNFADDTLTVYSRNGVGTWFVAATPSTGDEPMGLCSTDIDGDGDTDVAVADSGDDTVSFLRGTSLSTISLAARTGHATDVHPVDVDPWDPDNTKGGAQSLVSSNRNGNSMSFLLNNGGGFNAPVNFGAGAGPFQVITGDLNLDGDSDVATLNDDGTMTIFISDGAGGFLSGAPVPVGDTPLSFARDDLDLDGDLDLAVVAQNDSSIPVVKVFRNDTDPFDNNLTLASPTEVSTTSPQIVLTGMADGDSRPDIITVGSGLRSTTTITSVANSSFCPADFNRDAFVTGEDFDEFVYEFELGTADADFNHDGFTTGEDFDGFVLAFVEGC